MDLNDLKPVPSLYPRGHQFPFTKQVTLSLSHLPFYTCFFYVDDKGDTVPFAEYSISEHPGSNASQYLSKSPVKLRVRVLANGLLSVNSATISYEKDEPIEEATETSEKMETDQENAGEQNAPGEAKRKSKPKVATIDLLVQPISVRGELTKEEMAKFIEFEANMILADKNWKEKTDSRNTLEEFLYEWRDRLETGAYDAFIDPIMKKDFMSKIEENYSWLVSQDEQDVMHSKSVYDERTQGMIDAFSKGIMYRKREFENRPQVLEQFGQRLQMAYKMRSEPVEAGLEEDLAKFATEIDEKQKWFDEVSGKLSNMRTTSDPVHNCDEIVAQMNSVDASIHRYNSARTRRAQEEKKKAEAAAKKKQEEAAAAAAAAASSNGNKEDDKQQTAENGQTKMEVEEPQDGVAQATA